MHYCVESRPSKEFAKVCTICATVKAQEGMRGAMVRWIEVEVARSMLVRKTEEDRMCPSARPEGI